MTSEHSIDRFAICAKAFAVAVFVGLGTVPGLSQPIQFDWVTSTPGYAAEITLDLPSSTHGGLGDILSASITTPDFGTINYTPATGHLNNPKIVWTSTELEQLSLDWSVGPVMNQENPELGASQFGALILNFNSGQPNPFHYDIDQAGSWVAVPDEGKTWKLLALSLAALATAAALFKRISI